MTMHPVIRIVTFFIIAISVAVGNVQHLLLACLLLAAGYVAVHAEVFSVNWKMLKRMKWLFLSIFIVYLWFTPGDRLFQSDYVISPTIQGIEIGFIRVASLVVIVFAVNLLIRTIVKDDLIAAILWLLKPLKTFGLPHEKLAIRMALTLDMVGEVQTLYDDRLTNNGSDQGSRPGVLHRIREISNMAIQFFQLVLEKAINAECKSVTVSEGTVPSLLQWGYPLVLGMLVYSLTVISFLD